MTAILEKTGKKLFAAHLEQYAPVDPYYEYYTDKKGRKKRRKRELPPGLSARDAKILQSVNRRAHHLDRGFNLGGMRFGWAAIIGIVPGAGDVADIFLNYYLVVCKAREAEIPGWLVRRMLINNGISAVVGAVPIVGDILLAQFKANYRNAALLEEFLRIRGEVYLKMKAEGKDVIQVGAPKPKAKRQLFGKGKGKETEVVDIGGGKKAPVPKGTSKSDAEQIKPGAGLEEGEVISDEKKTPVASEPFADAKSAPNEKSQIKEPDAKSRSPTVTEPATTSSSGKAQGKRKLSFSLWRTKENGKGKQAHDRGRFVEDLTVDQGAASTSAN